jgi:hypothetical protein
MALVRHPSRQAFGNMVRDPEYREKAPPPVGVALRSRAAPIRAA